MRTILKIIAAPFILALILAVAVLSFLSCVAGAVCVVACVGLSLLGSFACWPGRPQAASPCSCWRSWFLPLGSRPWVAGWWSAFMV